MWVLPAGEIAQYGLATQAKRVCDSDRRCITLRDSVIGRQPFSHRSISRGASIRSAHSANTGVGPRHRSVSKVMRSELS